MEALSLSPDLQAMILEALQAELAKNSIGHLAAEIGEGAGANDIHHGQANPMIVQTLAVNILKAFGVPVNPLLLGSLLTKIQLPKINQGDLKTIGKKVERETKRLGKNVSKALKKIIRKR